MQRIGGASDFEIKFEKVKKGWSLQSEKWAGSNLSQFKSSLMPISIKWEVRNIMQRFNSLELL